MGNYFFLKLAAFSTWIDYTLHITYEIGQCPKLGEKCDENLGIIYYGLLKDQDLFIVHANITSRLGFKFHLIQPFKYLHSCKPIYNKREKQISVPSAGYIKDMFLLCYLFLIIYYRSLSVYFQILKVSCLFCEIYQFDFEKGGWFEIFRSWK